MSDHWSPEDDKDWRPTARQRRPLYSPDDMRDWGLLIGGACLAAGLIMGAVLSWLRWACR